MGDGKEILAMTELRIQLDPEDADRLGELAKQCGKSPEQLVQENLHRWLADERTEFLETAKRVFQKDAELYRRLA